MIEINLLPWRQEQYARKIKQQRYLFMIALALGMFFIMSHVMFAWVVSSDNAHAARLKKQNHFVKTSSHDNALFNMKINQDTLFHVFEKIERMDFYSLQMIKIQYTGKQIMISGHMRSAYDISRFIQTLPQPSIKKFSLHAQSFYLVVE